MSNSRIGSAQRRGQFAFQSKALQEEAIVRRREASRQRNEFWDTTSKYFERYHRCVESSLTHKEKNTVPRKNNKSMEVKKLTFFEKFINKCIS